MTERLAAGWCQHCRIECADHLGSQVYPNTPDIADRVFWCCQTPGCGARVGSHKATGKALGTAANSELRNARRHVHSRLDPIWEKAYEHPSYASARTEPDEGERRKALAIIRKTARKRVYEFLGDALGLSYDQAHVAMLDIDECRQAWRALAGISYDHIRVWSHKRKKAEA